MRTVAATHRRPPPRIWSLILVSPSRPYVVGTSVNNLLYGPSNWISIVGNWIFRVSTTLPVCFQFIAVRAQTPSIYCCIFQHYRYNSSPRGTSPSSVWFPFNWTISQCSPIQSASNITALQVDIDKSVHCPDCARWSRGISQVLHLLPLHYQITIDGDPLGINHRSIQSQIIIKCLPR